MKLLKYIFPTADYRWDTLTYKGGKYYLRWWKNKPTLKLYINDSCTTEALQYKIMLEKYAVYRWELTLNYIQDTVTVAFASPSDFTFFKMKWG